MNLWRPIASLVIIILVMVSLVHADARVKARVDRTAITSGESLQLEVTITDGSGEVDLSPLTGFKVIPRGTSSNVQIIQGRMSQEDTYTYLLLPLKTGKMTIPALTVMVDGKTHTTAPIDIVVSKTPAAGGKTKNAPKGVWVTAELSDESPFQGQQVIYTFRLFNNVQISNVRFQPPSFKGFTAKEIKEHKTFRKTIDGSEHLVSEVNFILTPLDAGPKTIDPSVLQVGVLRQDRRRRRSPFDDFFNRTVKTKVLQTRPLDVSVTPLPPHTGPQPFSGLVGRFVMTAGLEPVDLKVGDSATLSVTIKGRGNIMDVQNPKLDLPDKFKQYADNPQETVLMDDKGHYGEKVFRTALVPVEAGSFALPAVQMDYFDISEKAYRTLEARLPEVMVTAPKTVPSSPAATTPQALPPLKKKVAFTGRDILPPKAHLSAIQSRRPIPWTLFLMALMGPALIFGCLRLVQHLRRSDNSPAARMAVKSRLSLKAAANCSGEGFLTRLYQALTAAIFAAAGRSGEALTWKEAQAHLIDSGFSPETAQAAARLLADIESYKFSGRKLDSHQESQLLDQTRKMVKRLAS